MDATYAPSRTSSVQASDTLKAQFDTVCISVENSVSDNHSVKDTVSQIVIAIDDVAQQTQQANENFAELTKASITLLSASLYTETGVAMVILPTLLGNAVR